jgi:hypothetical protein
MSGWSRSSLELFVVVKGSWLVQVLFKLYPFKLHGCLCFGFGLSFMLRRNCFLCCRRMVILIFSRFGLIPEWEWLLVPNFTLDLGSMMLLSLSCFSLWRRLHWLCFLVGLVLFGLVCWCVMLSVVLLRRHLLFRSFKGVGVWCNDSCLTLFTKFFMQQMTRVFTHQPMRVSHLHVDYKLVVDATCKSIYVVCRAGPEPVQAGPHRWASKFWGLNFFSSPIYKVLVK